MSVRRSDRIKSRQVDNMSLTDDKEKQSTIKSSKSNASQIRRLKLKAELDAAEQLARLEQTEAEELAKVQLKSNKVQEEKLNKIAASQKALIRKRLENDIANIEASNISDDNDSHLGSDIDIRPLHEISETAEVKVENWIKGTMKNDNASRDDEINNVQNEKEHGLTALAQAIVQAVQNSQTHRNGGELQNLLSRQTVGKDLPHFSGVPEEWPCFIAEFQRSTLLCGFSDVENMHRLQKALRGRARETVQVMLHIPDQVNNIISILERRFGRPDSIIKHLIEKVKFMRSPKEGEMTSLIEFGDAINNVILTVKMLGREGYMQNPQLLEDFVQKLPANIQLKWGERIVEINKNIVTLEDFSLWMQKIVEAASYVEITCPSRQYKDSKFDRRDRRTNNRESVFVTTQNTSSRKMYCQLCKNREHNLVNCQEFQKFEVEQRWIWVKDNKTCFSCLRFGHKLRQCRNKQSCGHEGCKRPHNYLLHQQLAAIGTEEHISREEEILSHTTAVQNRKILLRIAPVTLMGPLGAIKTYGLFDEASTITLLDEDVGKEIGATGPIKSLRMRWTNSLTCEENESRSVSLKIKGENNGDVHALSNVRTVKNLSLPVQSIDVGKFKNKWKHLEMANTISLVNAKPTILIGQDNIDLIIAREVVEGSKNAPVASKTKLGWVIHGNVNQYSGRVDEDFTLHVTHDENQDSIHQMVKEYFDTENFGVLVRKEKFLSQQDSRAQNLMNITTNRIDNQNRWETGLLWKQDNTKLPRSKFNATKRLNYMERKIDRDATFCKAYCDKIDEFVVKGYARKLSNEQAVVEEDKTWYLPHFAVVNPNKPGKIRFVFDAASKVNGMSLNDALLKGPDLLNSLTGIIFKFRQRKIAFGADIKEMFPQIKIIQEDRAAQRFLWRGTRRDINPEVYEMTSMIFGAVCSPSSAQYVLHRNAKECEDIKPDAVKAILNKHYMDDYLDSVDTVEEAEELIQDVINIHKRGGFVICNWISNSAEVLDKIPTELISEKHTALEKKVTVESQSDRILGLWWNTNEDTFHFKLKLNKICEDIVDGRRVPTKREILRIIMSIFDPLGFVAQFTIYGKILLQDIWRSGINWDDELTTHMYEKWKTWFQRLKTIDKIKIPRCYSQVSLNKAAIQLHIFCDASEKAFAAVAYVRITENEETSTAFIAAKCRVASLKPMSIPRLELQAALLGSRLATTIKEEHEIEFENTIYWSDSKTVLCWLRSDARKFKQFVANRVGEIEELTDISEWRWIPTKENVADEGTKWSSIQELSEKDRWYTGPKFLLQQDTEWPKENHTNSSNDVDEEALELKREFIAVINEVPNFELPDVNRFSKWLRIVRATAWLQRFMNNCLAKIKKRTVTNTGELTPQEFADAEKLLIKRSQQESYRTEIYLLKNGKQVDKTSSLYQLSPMLDTEGILKMRGRLEMATNVSKHIKRPFLLDPKHSFTKLLIEHFHSSNGHQGQETVVNELRQKYWIPKIRHAVKGIWRRCQICKNLRTLPIPPEMGQLPTCRLNERVRPFTCTGVDYFGPIMVTIGRRREKRYGVLFTCMSTRAVHLEVAASLNTDSCIMAIRRMMARRGCPKEIFSDNGKNFRGADKELKAALEQLRQEEIINYLTPRGIDWHFIPPLSPHMGGCWERLVRSVKTALKTTLKERAPREEVLLTLLLEAEHIVNSRPLTYVSSDPTNEEYLTPNHFLLGSSSSVQIPGIFDNQEFQLRKQWRISQRLADMFWKRWVKEYLPTLVKRTKWHQETNPVKVGDIVFIADGNFPRNTWPKGKIIKVYPGRDGKIRVVDVKTLLGTYKRSVAKLAVLDINNENVEEH